MNEATIILQNMRGGCVTVGDKVHALFRLNGQRRKTDPQTDAKDGSTEDGRPS